MKTIEERAEYYERRCIDNANALGWSELPRPLESYKQGANEQKAIDDANLQERFEKVLNGQKWDLIDKACQWLKARNVLTDASIEGFRKAMEE